ncbi:MAG TPA: amidase, partial [Planctomycetota bacterium]|nr:amidase [Planctomycetota bacterium]
ETVRRALKENAIASNLVLATLPRAGQDVEDGLLLTGRGRGHGVGLCQTGARALARAGWSAAEILAHYYPGSVLVDGR